MDPTAISGELVFRTSSYSKTNNCVEVASSPLETALRDSKHQEKGHLSLSRSEWAAFLGAARTHSL
ncbi:hypothetical protein HNR23_000710 [Nocardiopsis mwathae]|uniref:DUF397 domain-containing protein n=1 Tax=Nocardiopsis mwathae TaxID=1472723 RepID=A0A7W9YED7_9ACTN|nr:DUF397 domain-containing protein [Nocardiopsis mwathae]MBB6170650.1 hypothetical protein [Nocardiopsis mwathae]